MFVATLLFFLFFFVLLWAKNNSEGCGIEVFTWLQVYLSIATLGFCILLPILYCLFTKHPLDAFACTICSILFLTIALAAWVIYGYVIYFSPDNDCQKKYDTSVALIFMCIFLIFGLCLICSAVGGLVFVPLIYFGSIRPIRAEDERKLDPEDDRFLWVLVRTGYSNLPEAARKKIEKGAKKDIKKAEKDEAEDEAEGGGSDEEAGLVSKKPKKRGNRGSTE